VVELENEEGNIVPIRALLDTGTSSTIVLNEHVRKGFVSHHKGHETTWETLGGTFTTRRKGLLEFKLPELTNNQTVTWVAHVDDHNKRENALYDMIIGMDLMTTIGIYVNTEQKMVIWGDYSTPLKQRGTMQESTAMEANYHMAKESELLKGAEERQSRILDADYSNVDIDEYVEGVNKLNGDQKLHLKRILKSHPKLFGGGLGELNVKPVHLELKQGAQPYHAREYPVPQVYEKTTRKEIDRLTDIGVLVKDHNSPWAAATFIQPKKTGEVRVLTDFRKLNAVLLRHPYPLPKISDLLQKLQGFTYATAIDLSMGYYHIPLDEESQQLCTTILPWGKYRYRKLPMGIASAPDIFQSIKDELLGDLEFVRVYIDDILIVSDGTFEDHMDKLNQVLARLETAGFRANVRK
jgi:Reverse transcriptase (RNA-dependent DNA polymerase)/Aspartyl protease